MPKRTNEFQRLIARLERALAAPTEKVLESEELEEHQDGALREVDTLIEGTVAGHRVRVAIECRDWSRPQTVEWIDQLCGKYRDLDVSEIVAVSRSGFTETAKTKAARLNIRTYTLEEAQEENWPESLTRPHVRLLAHSHQLTGARIEYAPVTDQCTLDTPVHDGSRVEALGTWLKQLYERDQASGVLEYLHDVARGFLEEGWDRAVCIAMPFAGSGAYVEVSGSQHEIRRIHFRVEINIRAVPAETDHRVYRGNHVTLGTYKGTEKVFSIGFVQPPGRPDELKVAFQTIEDLTPEA